MSRAATGEVVGRDLVLAWADDEYVVGQQLVTLTGMYGPDLEEAVAIGSIAQDHLGYALNLYRMLCPDDRGVDRLVYERPASSYRSCLLADCWRPDDWAFIVARQLLYDLANRERQGWAGTLGGPWTGLTGMMRRETDLHVEHWSEWWRLLGSTRDGRHRLQRALDDLWPLTADFFTAPGESGAPWAGLLAPWLEAVRSACGRAGLAAPAPAGPPPRSGRRGEHLPELEPLLAEAHAVYLSEPNWTWG